MNVLLDSHALIWSVDDPARLGTRAASILEDPDNTPYVSMASVWELGIKAAKGRLALSMPFGEWILKAIHQMDIQLLPITLAHVSRIAGLPARHSDPFDRMLAAQCLAEGWPIVSADSVLDGYSITRLWD